MEKEATRQPFILPIPEGPLAQSFGEISIGVFKANDPQTYLERAAGLEMHNPWAYMNMAWMGGIRKLIDQNTETDFYDVGYVTFCEAAALQAQEAEKEPYDFSREDLCLAFSDLTQERHHPEWNGQFKELDIQYDPGYPIHPLNFIELWEKHKDVGEVQILRDEIQNNSNKMYKLMVTAEDPIRNMLEHVRMLNIDVEQLKSYAYGVFDSWNLHNAHLQLKRLQGMYTTSNQGFVEFSY